MISVWFLIRPVYLCTVEGLDEFLRDHVLHSWQRFHLKKFDQVCQHFTFGLFVNAVAILTDTKTIYRQSRFKTEMRSLAYLILRWPWLRESYSTCFCRLAARFDSCLDLDQRPHFERCRCQNSGSRRLLSACFQLDWKPFMTSRKVFNNGHQGVFSGRSPFPIPSI